MSIYGYESAFGAWDQTSQPMRKAIENWFSLYYGKENIDRDPSQRIAYTVVTKLVRTIFGEYKASGRDVTSQQVIDALSKVAKQAMQLSLIGGECYIKPCFQGGQVAFTLVPRDSILVFGRDSWGMPTDVGMVEKTAGDKCYYTLLERRRVDANGYLSIENRLYKAYNATSLGAEVPLTEVSMYANLPASYTYPEPVYSVGLVQLKTPMCNCVDGSTDGVSVYGAAAELIGAIDENEAQLRGEFRRGQSRILASRDLLRDGKLEDDLFVGLDDDPESLGITIFSPALREQSYLARKQEYLRNVESILGLRRGMLSDANAQDRTATEIASSAAEYNLTVIDFQAMWQQALEQALLLCGRLGLGALDASVSVDWGNGVLYDEDQTWEVYQQMVDKGMLKPEIALGWRFGLPTETEEQRAYIRKTYMPDSTFATGEHIAYQ